MPLTTRCGRCGRLFPVYAQELKGNRGRVPCPQCGTRVNAVAGLLDEPVLPGDAPALRSRSGADSQRRGQAPRAMRGSMVPITPPAMGSGAKRPAAPRRAPGTLARVGWGLASLVLILALGVQLAWWQRGALLRNPMAVRTLGTLCDNLGCTLPLARLPGALAVLDPSLAPDPATGALMLRLRVENRAGLPQPAPLIELELLDQQGDPAAVRRFTPEEYAAAGSGPAAVGPLAPGEQRALALALAAPREDASGFKVRLQ